MPTAPSTSAGARCRCSPRSVGPSSSRELPALLERRPPLRIDAHPRRRRVRRSTAGQAARRPDTRRSSAAEKAEAVQTLASRGRYGRMLTDALAKRDPEERCPAARRAAAAPRRRREVRRRLGTGRAESPRRNAPTPGIAASSTTRRWPRAKPCERPRRLPAHLRPCHKHVRRRRHDRARPHRLESRQPRLPAVQRPQPERRGSGRLQDGRRHHARRPHLHRQRRRGDRPPAHAARRRPRAGRHRQADIQSREATATR